MATPATADPDHARRLATARRYLVLAGALSCLTVPVMAVAYARFPGSLLTRPIVWVVCGLVALGACRIAFPKAGRPVEEGGLRDVLPQTAVSVPLLATAIVATVVSDLGRELPIAYAVGMALAVAAWATSVVVVGRRAARVE